MSKAYTELEKQFSTRQTEEPVKEEAKDLSIPKEEASDGFSVDKYAEEYADKGELTQKSYDEVAKQGLT